MARLPANSALTFRRCPLGHAKRIPICLAAVLVLLIPSANARLGRPPVGPGPTVQCICRFGWGEAAELGRTEAGYPLCCGPMTLLQILLLGIVQGLTEFLPVSSSGHLVVVNALLQTWGSEPVEDLVEVNIVLHLGTLAAVAIYYRREIWRLLGKDRRVIPLLVVGTIPAAVIGVTIKKLLPDSVEAAILENPLLAGLMFPVTAAALVWAMRRPAGPHSYTELSMGHAFVVGLAQAAALLPGISRSGATIAAGLGVGQSRRSSATFAFLLALPAIAGAGVLEALEMWEAGGAQTAPGILAVGFAVSMAVGLGALMLLIRWVERGKLAWFAYYLVPLGIATVLWQLAAYRL